MILIFTFVTKTRCKIEKNRDTMKDRIAHIMKAKNLKASDFATLLGIQPSGVSHILAGRNQPSLEFVKKIKETFPEYNLDWIIFGKGPMTTSEPYKEIKIDLETPTAEEKPASVPFFPADEMVDHGVKAVIILYEDGTFESFSPK